MMSRNKDAVRAYKQAVELKPDHFLAYNNLGTAYHRLGDFRGAVEAYKQAIGIKSDYPEAIFSLGVSYLELKDQDAAMEQHKRLAAIDEERADKLYNLIKNKISLQVLNGKAISLPKPLYPAQARAAHASGVVIVWVQIDETGKVVSASTVTGHILLRLAAIEAAKLARFTPTTLDGQPVKVSGLITYNFVLEEPGRKYLPPN
jgi:TonB family protein